MAAEQKISAALENEFESVDKDCIRPLQVPCIKYTQTKEITNN